MCRESGGVCDIMICVMMIGFPIYSVFAEGIVTALASSRMTGS